MMKRIAVDASREAISPKAGGRETRKKERPTRVKNDFKEKDLGKESHPKDAEYTRRCGPNPMVRPY